MNEKFNEVKTNNIIEMNSHYVSEGVLVEVLGSICIALQIKIYNYRHTGTHFFFLVFNVKVTIPMDVSNVSILRMPTNILINIMIFLFVFSFEKCMKKEQGAKMKKERVKDREI